MTAKEGIARQQMLSNKHLKEWNDNIASEAASLYQLRCKHGIERDQLAFDKITDTEQQSKLASQQLNEADELKQHNSEKRVAIQERHLKEKTESATLFKAIGAYRPKLRKFF